MSRCSPGEVPRHAGGDGQGEGGEGEDRTVEAASHHGDLLCAGGGPADEDIVCQVCLCARWVGFESSLSSSCLFVGHKPKHE